jgi:hypothetical protein
MASSSHPLLEVGARRELGVFWRSETLIEAAGDGRGVVEVLPIAI